MAAYKRPDYRVQIYVQTWTRDNQPKDASWINLSVHKTLESAVAVAEFEERHKRNARIQQLINDRYKTIEA